MYIDNLAEIKKVAGYRKFENGECIIEIEKIDFGYLIKGQVKGVIDKLEIFSMPMPDKLLVNNWQSWGPSRVIRKGFKLSFPSELIQKFGFSASVMPEEYFNTLLSDYLIASEDFVIGSLSSKIGHPYFRIEDDKITVMLRYFERNFDDWTDIEPFVVLRLNADIGLPHYADLIAQQKNVKFASSHPLGWSSWYQYFLDFDYEKMMGDLRRSKELGLNYEVFQIDDAWEKDIGDWEPNEKFPSLEKIANDITSYGYVPGIWLAPFSISETSQIFKFHPDWLVKDNNGNPVVAYENWNKKIYALDTTHPEVTKWLSELFKNLKKSGFNYFKIDFLFAAAIQGKRYENVTPIEAYRKGLEIIRKSVGDSFVLGCGAPLLPSVGYVDGMRISADTAPFWDPTGPDIGYPNAYYALRNVITRGFMNNVLWWNDPDCLMLRKEDTQLNDKHRELYTLVSLMLDNMIIQSDNLSYKIDLELWNKVLEYKKYGRRKFKVEGLMDERYKITSAGVNGVDELLISDLSSPTFEMNFDKKRVELTKNVEKRPDGRTFNYYTEPKSQD
ncbi:MAG: glycoside hydrolase family 36 protein [Fervidobacterium sp.]|uniref:glycoside hydrolase family 36 protein n=1 Tax=Fervidobacterium sp. TaxID=1871331 RepID=UPI004048F834